MKRMKILACLLALMLMTVAIQAQHQSKIYFESGQAMLSPGAKKSLDSIIQLSQIYGDYELIIKAYTDDVGAEDYNKRLAEQRAENTRRHLLGKQKMRPIRIQIESIGELALDQNIDEQLSRQLNRRVDVRIDPFYPQSLQDLFGYFQKKATQQFSFDATQGTTIVGRYGGLVNIPAMAFTDKNGKPFEGKVHLTMQEAYVMGDMLKQNLGTMSNGKILETGGMMYLGVEDAQGNPLNLAEGQSVEVSMPGQRELPRGMQLFTAERSRTTPEQPIDWRPENRAFISLNVERIYHDLSQAPYLLRPVLEWKYVIPPAILPDPIRKPKRPSPMSLYQNPIEEPTLSAIEAKRSRRKGEKARAYRKRIRTEYERKLRAYRVAQKNNEKRLAQHEKLKANYERIWNEYRADSTRYELYVATMQAERKRLNQQLDSLMPSIEEHLAANYPPNQSCLPVVNDQFLLQRFGQVNYQLRYLKGIAQEMNIRHQLGKDSFNMKKAFVDLRKSIRNNYNSVKSLQQLWLEYNRHLKWFDLLRNPKKYLLANKQTGERLPDNISYNDKTIDASYEFYDVYLLTQALNFVQRERQTLVRQHQELDTKLQSIMKPHLESYEQFRTKMFSLADVLKKNQERLAEINESLKRDELKRRLNKGGLSNGDMSNYFRYSVRSNRLGWINCDRFQDYEGETTDVLVQLDEPLNEKNMMLFVLFTQSQSALTVNLQDDRKSFGAGGKIPLDQEAQIVGVYAGKDGFMMCKLPKTSIRQFKQRGLRMADFKKVQLEEFEKSVAQL